MKKITTILLSLLMVFALCLNISAEDRDDNALNNDPSIQTVNVAKVGDTEYATLQEAIDNAQPSATVTLISSISVNEIKIEKDLTLDLNGYDISGLNKNIVLKNITVTIKDSKAVDPTVNNDYSVNYQGGTITFVGRIKVGDRISVEDNAKLTVDSGHIKSTGVAFSVNGGGSGDSSPISSTVSINGGYIESQEGVGVFGEGAVLNVNGGIILAHDNASIAGNGTSEKGGTEINITGGTIIGNIQSSGYISVGIYHPQKGVLNITGGTIYSSDGNGICIRGGQVNISNATIIAKGTNSGKCGDSTVVTSSNAILVDYNSNYYDKDNIKVTIESGNLSSDKEAIGVLGDSTDAISVSGGSFSSDVSKYLVEGYNVANISNKFVVVKDGEKAPVTEKVTPAVDEMVFKTATIPSEYNDVTSIVLKSEEKPLSESEKNLVDQKLNESDLLKDKKLEYFSLDLKLVPYVGNEEKAPITRLVEDITVTLYLDDATVAKLQGKTVKVVRIHYNDDNIPFADLLDAELQGNALIFRTDRFSNYTIVYEADVANTTPTENKSYNVKDKNHDGVVSCEEEMDSPNWIWSNTKKACVYKVTNTSVR